MKTSTTSTGAGRRLRKSRGEDGRTPAARRLKRLTQAFLAEAGLNTPTEGQLAAAARAAGATVQLEALDAALGRGEEIDALAYSRLDGVARRNRRALGLDPETGPLSSGMGAAASPGLRLGQKKKPAFGSPEAIAAHERFIYCLRNWDELTLEEKLEFQCAYTPEDRKFWIDVWAHRDAVKAREKENEERAAKGLSPLPDIPARDTGPHKRFNADGDRPRENE